MSATAITLRPYQAEAIERLRNAYRAGHKAPLLAMPTGAGKTVVFAAVGVGAVAKGRRVLVVAHRRELIRQAADKLRAAGVQPGVICPGFKPDPDALVRVASIQTVVRRLGTLPPLDLIVIDEAHHACAAQYRRLVDAQPGAKLLGVTATPLRLDGKGLGLEAAGLFDELVAGPSIRTLTASGFLCPAAVFAPPDQVNMDRVAIRAGDFAAEQAEAAVDKVTITGSAISHYRNHADHKPALVYCVSVRHAEHVAENFRDAGYRAAAVSGATPARERDAAIAGLATGDTEVLCSCALIDEGLDVPAVAVIVMLRPTASLGLYMQQVGRGLRPAPGKDALIVLDHVGNALRHGLPDTERAWSLQSTPKKSRNAGQAQAAQGWRCDVCGRFNRMSDPVCASCEEPRTRRKIEEVAGELVELNANSFERLRHMTFPQMMQTRLSPVELQEYARIKGYKRGWAQRRFIEQERVWGSVAA